MGRLGGSLVAEYIFKMRAQAWRDDNYYVNSNEPVSNMEVIADTKEGARTAAQAIMDTLPRGWHYKFWFDLITDVRLIKSNQPVPIEDRGLDINSDRH